MFEHPNWIVFQLLERCNLRCSMCYEWGDAGAYHQKPRADLAELPFEVIERVVRDCAPARPYYEFFGGEPLLYPRVEDAIRLIRAAGSELAIPTNGVLVESLAEMLVDAQPTRLWFSLDGPEEANDAQRGRGVFRRVQRGLDRLHALRTERGQRFPEIGITFVVTPGNHRLVETFFFDAVDLGRLDQISIEFQCFATRGEYEQHARVLRQEFGIPAAPFAAGYVTDPSAFAAMDFAELARQMEAVQSECRRRGVVFVAHPRTIDAASYRAYFEARREDVLDHRTRCAFPWTYAEIAAGGDVTTCHSFYDHTIGNVRERPFLELWRGEAAKRLRAHLRGGLFPICTACCRYYNNPTSSMRGGAGGR